MHLDKLAALADQINNFRADADILIQDVDAMKRADGSERQRKRVYVVEGETTLARALGTIGKGLRDALCTTELRPAIEAHLLKAVEAVEELGRLPLLQEWPKAAPHAFVALESARMALRAQAKGMMPQARPTRSVVNATTSETKMSVEAKAMAYLVQHPSCRTLADVAKGIGASRGHLYRQERFKQAWAVHCQQHSRPPRGWRTSDGDIEAVDEGE